MVQNLWYKAKAVLSLKKYLPILKNKNLKPSNVTLKGTRKRRINKAQIQFKERNNKDQSGNKVHTHTGKINKTKSWLFEDKIDKLLTRIIKKRGLEIKKWKFYN